MGIPVTRLRLFTMAVWVGAVVLLTLLLASPPASARQCASVRVSGGFAARVYITSGPVTCLMAQTVAKEYYARRDGRWDGRGEDGSIYYRVRGYKCFTGLGSSEAYCRKRGGRRIFATIRTDR